VTVSVGSLRQQAVTIQFGQRDSKGHELISYWSTCGSVTEANAMMLVRYNAKMVHGGFAIQNSEAGEMVIVQANQLSDATDLLEIMRTMTALAWQADKVEEKLTGEDLQ